MIFKTNVVFLISELVSGLYVKDIRDNDTLKTNFEEFA